LKIALCIPSYGDTKAKFTACLAEMIVHTMSAKIEWAGEIVRPEIKTFIVSSSILPENRNRLVAEAIHWDADYMLWMDADHVFPRDALLILLSHNLPVVGCNYSRRISPTAPTASKEVDGVTELVWTEDGNGIEEVSHLGLGFCLIDMRLFSVLEQKAIEQGKEHFWPLFEFKPNGIGFTGEDVGFFKLIREAGIPVYVDHDLSWVVGHISEQILTCAHALKDKAKWLEFKRTEFDKFKEPA
jgi:hypothetical protein